MGDESEKKDASFREGWLEGLRDALGECDVALDEDPKHVAQVLYTRGRIQGLVDGTHAPGELPALTKDQAPKLDSGEANESILSQLRTPEAIPPEEDWKALYLDLAQVIGMTYGPDNGPDWPAPHDEIVRVVRETKWNANCWLDHDAKERAMRTQDEDCKIRPCACECHTDIEEPGPHIATCAWADPAYEPRPNDTKVCGDRNVDNTTCILTIDHDGNHYDAIGYWAGHPRTAEAKTSEDRKESVVDVESRALATSVSTPAGRPGSGESAPARAPAIINLGDALRAIDERDRAQQRPSEAQEPPPDLLARATALVGDPPYGVHCLDTLNGPGEAAEAIAGLLAEVQAEAIERCAKVVEKQASIRRMRSRSLADDSDRADGDAQNDDIEREDNAAEILDYAATRIRELLRSTSPQVKP